MATIALKSIQKDFGSTRILHSIDLTIEDGEFLVLVGPSGCGKSTLLRLIAGLEHPTKGDIFIDGVSTFNVPPKDRNLAMVFQSYALYPHMTVAENMGLSLRIKKTPKATIQEEVERVAETLGLRHLLGRKPAELSGGQRQRVAMGRAIIRNPRAFLFDEPLSNLDAALRMKMRTEIKKLHQKLGVTTVYVTHDQTEAMTLADRIVILNEGVIQQIGRPMEIYQSPINRFVAGFVGSPAMNFIPLKWQENHHHWRSGTPFENNHAFPKEDLHLGIRPEDFRLNGDSNEGERIGTAKISVLEPLGSDMLVDVDFHGQEIKVKTDWDPKLLPGQECSLWARKLTVFQSDSGMAL